MRKLSPLGSTLIRFCSWATSQGRDGSALAVLVFHRVLPEFDPLLSSEPDAADFSAILDLLSAHFRVLGLSEAVGLLRNDCLPKRALCVTFDDGYASNFTVALPILSAKGIPATVFIASAFLNGGRMFNDTIVEAVRCTPKTLDLNDLDLGLYHLRDDVSRVNAIESIIMKLKYAEPHRRSQFADGIAERAGLTGSTQLMMTDEHVRCLHRSGVQIGAHTATHPILTTLNDGAALQEMVAGKKQLEAIISAPVTVFAYPNGKPGTDYSRAHVGLAKQAGFEAAVSTAWGVADHCTDLFQIPRIAPWDRSALRYALRIATSYRQRKFARV